MFASLVATFGPFLIGTKAVPPPSFEVAVEPAVIEKIPELVTKN